MPIVKFQTPKDFAIINLDFPNSVKIGKQGKGEKFFFSRKKEVKQGCFIEDGKTIFKNGGKREMVPLSDIGLRGGHNLENIMAAILAGICCGVEGKTITKVIKNFKGLEHRLEEVATKSGVVFFNDSFSTTPEAAIAAIMSFSEPEIVILGGSDKGSDFTQLAEVLTEVKNIKAVILIGLMADRIEKAILQIRQKINFNVVRGCKTMHEIVVKSMEIASKGDVVLLSPACASFDMFANYKDRGEQFKSEVNKLYDRTEK